MYHLLSLCLILVFLLSGCSTPGPLRQYGHEDAYGRYYDAKDGRLLRVESDGSVYDISCVGAWSAVGTPLEKLKCKDGNVELIGKVSRNSARDDWDTTGYEIAPESGTCEPLMPIYSFGGLKFKRRSCWNRLWEVPTTVALIPVLIVVFVIYVVTPPDRH